MVEELLIEMLTPFLRKMGIAAVGPIVDILVRRFGKDVVQGHIDSFDIARAVADALEDSKFGPATAAALAPK